jgi:hypothetical protein
VGFFLATMYATATIIAWDNANYYYNDGVFYQPYNGGYQVVAPPVGAIVPRLPSGTITLDVDGITYWYFGGTFFVPAAGGYQVVAGPPGAIVYNLPDGCTTVNAGGVTYLQFNGTYFQPIQDADGQNGYEVVDVE